VEASELLRIELPSDEPCLEPVSRVRAESVACCLCSLRTYPCKRLMTACVGSHVQGPAVKLCSVSHHEDWVQRSDCSSFGTPNAQRVDCSYTQTLAYLAAPSMRKKVRPITHFLDSSMHIG